MKKQTSAVLIISVLLFSTTAFAQQTAEAQVIGEQSAQINFEDTTVTEAEIQASEEEFDNTGLLPDHPFYGFKRFGEDVGLFFAADNAAKARIHLELAKKRLAEAKAMLEKQEERLAEKALEEQENQLNESKNKREELRALGKNVSEPLKETDNVLQKSILVLELMKDKLPEKAQQRIEVVIKKQIEHKVRVHKTNATNDDIEEESSVQERIKVSMYEKISSRFDSKIDRLEASIEKAEEENDTEKIEQLEELKEKIEEQKEKALEKLEKLRERVKERAEKTLEKIDKRIEKAEEEGRNKTAENLEKAKEILENRTEKILEHIGEPETETNATTEVDANASANVSIN